MATIKIPEVIETMGGKRKKTAKGKKANVNKKKGVGLYVIAGAIGIVIIALLVIHLMGINEQPSYTAILTTNKGVIKIALFNEYTPITVNNFVSLAEAGFYNNVIFHRVIKGFMIQGGCPLGTGAGGPGHTIVCEFAGYNRNSRGTIAMANRGPNTGGSQFFINLVDNLHLDGRHTVFGRVIDGMDVVDAIGAVETDPGDRPIDSIIIASVEIIRN